jgi:hypothetical protein
MLNERKLPKSVEKMAQALPDAEFKKRYGKNWKSVKIATAQKLAENFLMAENCGCSACNDELEERKGKTSQNRKKKKKRDRCLRIADRKFKKPSAYKSGAVVRCRKGNIWKGVKEVYHQLDEKEKENLNKWFKRQGASGKEGGWVDCNTCRKDPKTGRQKCKTCGRKKGEKRAKYPSCKPTPSKCKDPGKGKTWGKTKEQKIREVIQNVIKNTIA